MKQNRHSSPQIDRRTFNKLVLASTLAASTGIRAADSGPTQAPTSKTVLYNGWVLTQEDLLELGLTENDL